MDHMLATSIPVPFLTKACALLADTNSGISGPKIIEATAAYADQWMVNIPYAAYPNDAPNKRTALLSNLQAFEPPHQFIILEDLCEHYSFPVGSSSRSERSKLKAELYARYGHLRPNKEVRELDAPLIDETKHWLQPYPGALKAFDDAKLKYDAGAFQRNMLDDLRLSLELLLKALLENEKSLENQLPFIGARLKQEGATSQFTNMFQKLLDHYANFQNENIKHDDKPPESEIEFVFDITASFMKHLVKVIG